MPKSSGRKGSGGKKQTSQRVSKIASEGLRTGKLSKTKTRTVSGSALGQDETRGPRKKR